jgi:hypothetical protein
MLPGDIVLMYVKALGKKLKFKEGHVIRKGAPGFQCKDCKYYFYSGDCLLIEGKSQPKPVSLVSAYWLPNSLTLPDLQFVEPYKIKRTTNKI